MSRQPPSAPSNPVRKLCVVTGNRTDYSRCRTVMQAIAEHPGLRLQLIVTGAHLLPRFGHTVEQIIADGFTPDEYVYQIVEGETPTTMARSIGLGICDLATCFERLRPDVVIVPGDRFEALSAAVAAATMNLRLTHIQGGEVSGSIDESIRHAITKLAHIHFPATEGARARIIAMGEDPRYVFNVGCPGTDLIAEAPVMDREETMKALRPLWKIGRAFKPQEPFLLLLQHPVTTQFSEQAKQMLATLEAMSRTGLNVLSLWPNIDAGAEQMVDTMRTYLRTNGAVHRFATFRHISPPQFINLMRHAACMIGNSSAGIREACYLGTPVVNIGIRQQRRERGRNVVEVPCDPHQIYQATMQQIQHGPYPTDPIYGDGRAGQKIAQLLAELDLPPIQKVIQY